MVGYGKFRTEFIRLVTINAQNTIKDIKTSLVWKTFVKKIIIKSKEKIKCKKTT